jgi:hypothetical protein
MTDEPHDLTLLSPLTEDDLISDELVDDWDAPGQPPALSIDWGLYEHYLEASDLPDDDKRALIETLWSIMVSFVDLGFRISPLQQIGGQDICGEVDPMTALAEKTIRDVVKLEDTNKEIKQTNDGACVPSGKEETHE